MAGGGVSGKVGGAHQIPALTGNKPVRARAPRGGGGERREAAEAED